MTSSIPAMVENHLDAIDLTAEGKVILGSSNLTGRYWNGSLWCFKSIEDAPDVEKCITGVDVSSGVCDLLCLSENRVALGLDSGAFEMYQLDDETEEFKWTYGICEHDGSIMSLSLNSTESNIITVGSDQCTKIWDLKTMTTTATYRPIHGGIIWQVSCSTTDPNLFITCGQDEKILLFDVRLPKPATLLDNDSIKGCPTAVCWKPADDYLFAVGDESGSVTIKDIRQIKSVCSWNAHERQIFRIAFSPSKCHVATCCDGTEVVVAKVEGEDANLVLTSDIHLDFIRGLKWTSENDLVSCGWDKRVLKHSLKNVNISQ